jgi:tryptophan-rich sensory protein
MSIGSTTDAPLAARPAWKSFAALLLILAVTFYAPALGAFTLPGAWYASLSKPSWNPPAWVFGPVWTALYMMMAVAAWLVWRRGGWPAQRRPLTLYLVQLALNAAWTPIFFGLKNPGLAFAEILLLLMAIVFTAHAFRRASPAAALLFMPYLLWVSFATTLNFTLWRLNS